MQSLKITPQITKREAYSFNIYLQEVTKLTKKGNLSISEEIELSKRIKKGDKKAEKELVERNLRFVVSVAKQYQNDYCLLEDLVNEGNIGLLKAARSFDEKRNCKFISYAVWWIRQSIISYINDSARMIRLPLNKINQISKIKNAQEKFFKQNNRKPTTEEILDLLEDAYDSKEAEKLMSIGKPTQSLSSPLPNNEDINIEDTLVFNPKYSKDEPMEDEDIKNVINRMLNRIPTNSRNVLEMNFGINGKQPKTLEEISIILKLSKERVRQLKNNGIRRLSNQHNFNAIKDYIK